MAGYEPAKKVESEGYTEDNTYIALGVLYLYLKRTVVVFTSSIKLKILLFTISPIARSSNSAAKKVSINVPFVHKISVIYILTKKKN